MSGFQKFGCLVLVIALLGGGFVLSKLLFVEFLLPTSAMEPLLQPGDHILARKSHATPHRGELLVFKLKDGYTLKRVVAVAGDKVRIHQKQLWVNGLLQEEEYAIHTDKGTLPFRDEFPANPGRQPIQDPAWAALLQASVGAGELTVPRGKSFALGDNRDNSFDSRFQGCYPDSSIVGYPSMILYSVELKSASMKEAPKPGALRWNRLLKSF